MNAVTRQPQLVLRMQLSPEFLLQRIGERLRLILPHRVPSNFPKSLDTVTPSVEIRGIHQMRCQIRVRLVSSCWGARGGLRNGCRSKLRSRYRSGLRSGVWSSLI